MCPKIPISCCTGLITQNNNLINTALYLPFTAFKLSLLGKLSSAA